VSGGDRRDAGMTLVEVLVAIGLFAVVGSLVLAAGIATSKITDTTTSGADLNEEARIAFERIARDLRDAKTVTAVVPLGGAASGTDCDGDADAADEFTGVAFAEGTTSTPDVPHEVAYRWDAGNKQLILSEAIPDPQQQPILAAEVTRFCVRLWSSRWDPVPDDPDRGTSWAELGAGSASPNPAGWWCPAQLDEVDRVTVSMTASLDGHERKYETDVFLRNADVDTSENGVTNDLC
jgi:prepilin-type N-terminal cleavage/methylation domain-containing protein